MALRKGIQSTLHLARNIGGINHENYTAQVFLRHIKSEESVEQFLDSYDTLLLDCDGVLWENDHMTPLPGISKAIQKLQRLGKNIIYVTNNSNVSRNCLREKFNQHGFESPLQNIFGNAYAAAVYLKDIAQIKGQVNVLGSEAMKWELDCVGLGNFGVDTDIDQSTSDISKLTQVKLHDNVDAVLVGCDPFMDFMKVFKASSYLCNESCHFVATNNVGRSCYIGDKKDRRMTGTVASTLAGTAQRQPVIVGKPHKLMFQCLLTKHPDIDMSRTVFIGDSLTTDMGFAKNIGLDSAMVLTGTGTMEQINKMPHLAPEYVLNSLADICD